MATLAELLANDPEAAGVANTSTAMAPAVNAHFSALAQQMSNWAAQQEATNRRLQGQPLSQQVLDPQSLQSAMSMALSTGPGAIRAYHGSPYDFDAFDASKIGTGEGAQAYGHGLYFAERPEVAQQYRDALGRPAIELNGQKIAPQRGSPEDIALAHLEDAFASQSSAPWARAYQSLQKALSLAPDTPTGTMRRDMDAAIKVLGGWQEAGAKPANMGRMYEVNINADPEQFLNWDKPATAQPENVQNALGQIWQQRGGTLEGRKYPPFAAHSEARGDALHAALATTLGTPQQAGAALNQAGIPGIRYLDQGSRFPGWQADHPALAGQTFASRKQALNALLGADPNIAQGALDRSVSEIPGDRTNNYVVFDPKIIGIVKKYGLAGLLATGAATMDGGDQK